MRRKRGIIKFKIFLYQHIFTAQDTSTSEKYTYSSLLGSEGYNKV
jgi:hypothetical protein